MSTSRFPLAGQATDGFSNEKEASATCFCGQIQIVVPITKPGYVTSFICHCSDCRKITASMFASNFVVKDSHMRFNRGENLLKQFGPQSKTIARGNEMANYFCSECGTLMFRRGSAFPGMAITRLGTVDDFSLIDGALKPVVEQFMETKCAWLPGAIDVPKNEGMAKFD